MPNFAIEKIKDVSIKNPVLIAGLPGIGNVGKLTVDFMIDNLNPELIYEIKSSLFPHAVFIDENDVITMPVIKLYAVKRLSQDLLLLAGDVQPATEAASYELAEKIIELAHGFGCKQIITFGGVGRPNIPDAPSMYLAGNSPEAMGRFKEKANKFEFKNCESIANIVGLAGLLVGYSKAVNIDAVSVLTDTFAHPAHFGLEESKQLLLLMDSLFNLGLDVSELDEEIDEMKKERKMLTQAKKQRQLVNSPVPAAEGNIDYIG